MNSSNNNKLRGRAMAAVMLLMALLTLPVSALETLGDRQRDAVLKPVVESYGNWGRVELNGKVHADMLPVTATVKIYMERNRQLLMSVRAPFVGEAARIEITADSLLLVNKLKRVYCTVDMATVNRIYPGALADLQTVLLGRMAIMGQGQMSKRSIANVEAYKTSDSADSDILIVPKSGWQPEGMLYGYTLGAAGNLLNMILVGDSSDRMVQLDYSAEGKGTDIDAEVVWGKRKIKASLSLDAPKWGASPFDSFKPTSRYKKVGIRQALSF